MVIVCVFSLTSLALGRQLFEKMHGLPREHMDVRQKDAANWPIDNVCSQQEARVFAISALSKELHLPSKGNGHGRYTQHGATTSHMTRGLAFDSLRAKAILTKWHEQSNASVLAVDAMLGCRLISTVCKGKVPNLVIWGSPPRTWRIIPFSKWLITMVIVSLINGLFMAYKWG